MGLPSACSASKQRLLLADQIQRSSVAQMALGPAFPAGLLGVAEGEHDLISPARRNDGLLDEPMICGGLRELYFIRPTNHRWP